MKSDNKTMTVIGAGSWGTALAISLANNGCAVNLWSFDANEMQLLVKDRCNKTYLPDVLFPEPLTPFISLSDALQGVSDVLIVVPSHGFRSICQELSALRQDDWRIVWATKGIDPEKLCFLHEVVDEYFGEIPMALFSGPSFAKEVAMGFPTAVALAANQTEFANDLYQAFHNPNFHIDLSEDIIGLEVGGALKNIIAIAAGISDGLGFGTNMRCALITYGLEEIMRFGVAMGAKHETFMGLSGVGDLVLTCTDNQSRNRRFGFALGQGKSVEEALAEVAQVVEGQSNVNLVYQMAQKRSIKMPITERIHQLLDQQISAEDAISQLFK